MKYYVIYDENGKASTVGCGDSLGGTEITEQEHNVLSAQMRAKTAYVNMVYSGEISLADVPAEWQEEIQQRVNARINAVVQAREQEALEAAGMGVAEVGD